MTSTVRGGIYVRAGADWRADFAGVNIGSFTSYASLAQPGPAIYPGAAWRAGLVAAGLAFNLVVELKHYGAGSPAGQSFTVEGRKYAVPVPDGRIQCRPGAAAWPVAWSYDQVLSGACDGLIHRLLAALHTIPPVAWVNVQLASEVDTDNEFGTQAGRMIYAKGPSDLKARAAYAYIIGWLRTPPAGVAPLDRNVTFSVGWSGAWSGFESFARLHDDAMPVQVVQWNVYNQNGNLTPYERLTSMMTSYRRLGPTMRSKPIIIAEWGTNAAHAGGQAPYIDAWPAAVARVNAEQEARGEGQIVMTNYFDSGWGLLNPRPVGIAALGRAYAAVPFR